MAGPLEELKAIDPSDSMERTLNLITAVLDNIEKDGGTI